MSPAHLWSRVLPCLRMLHATCHIPLATATAMEHAMALYGNVHPPAVLPFVVEHAGGIDKEGVAVLQDVLGCTWGCSGQQA